jgi:WD40 repeat protein
MPLKSAITALAITPDRKFLLVGTAGGMVYRYSSSLHPIGDGRKYPLPIAALRPLGDGTIYQIGTSEGLSSSALGSEHYPTRDRVHWIVPLANNGFAANEGPGRVVIWDGRWRQLFTEDVGDLRAAAATLDGKAFFTGGEDGIIRSWELPNDLVTRAVWTGSPITAIAVDPDANRVTVSQSRLLRDYFGGSRETAQAAGDHGFVVLRFRKDASALGVEFQGRTVVVRDPSIPSLRPVARFDLPNGAAPVTADLSTDGARLAIGDDRGRVIVWAIPTWERMAVIDCGHKGRVERVALADDGRSVAVPTPTGILINRIDDPRISVIVEGDDQAVFRFLPDGERLVSADRSGIVRIWQVAEGREEAAYYGHVGRVTSVGVSPDGRTIVSGSVVGEVKFWDVRTGQELISIRRHSGPVTLIEFAQNGKLLVTGGSGQVAFWQAGD